MNPIPRTAEEILDLVDRLPPEERDLLVRRLQDSRPAADDPAVDASFKEAQQITSKLKESLADVIVADREDRVL